MHVHFASKISKGVDTWAVYGQGRSIYCCESPVFLEMFSFSSYKTLRYINNQPFQTLGNHGRYLHWTVHLHQTCSAGSQVCVWCSWRYYPRPSHGRISKLHLLISFPLSHIDYELVILDMIPAADLTWRGNANELIASYAVCPLLLKYLYFLLTRKPSQADGYARVNCIGAFVTTFGPGELSAYCGMAGQYAEYVRLLQAILVMKANHV